MCSHVYMIFTRPWVIASYLLRANNWENGIIARVSQYYTHLTTTKILFFLWSHSFLESWDNIASSKIQLPYMMSGILPTASFPSQTPLTGRKNESARESFPPIQREWILKISFRNLERVKKFSYKVCLSSGYLLCDPRFGSGVQDESQNPLTIPAYVTEEARLSKAGCMLGKLVRTQPGK